ncbi:MULTISPECIES: hypothetical protein [Pseudomonas]|uniref:hypothetical protein n=1 Tax=Pseudomonas TaxID=286 RepID=UPI0007313F85|nr:MULTISPECIES: hypothetical protein [Pseudomonas]KTB97765.1 hypothetical protein AO388_25730 [Pseudomonas sp. ICMP 10191]POP79283.1 hypothetical protein CXB37_04015 [Pseudomonas syringae pv. syringae]
MTDLLTIDLPVTFFFEAEEPIPIDEIVSSLLGLQKLASKVPALVGALCEADEEVDLESLKVSKIQSGSLLEVLVLTLLFSSVADKEKCIKWLNETKMGKYAKYGLGGLLVLLLASEAVTMYDSFNSKVADKEETPSIQANHNIIINVGSSATGVTAEKLQAAVDSALTGDRKKVVRAALDFISPASGDGRGGLHVGDHATGLQFSHEAASDAPETPDFRARDTAVRYTQTRLEIRALDRDRSDTGWKGTLPQATGEKRLPLIFADGVDVTKAVSQEAVSADVEVVMATDFNRGVLIPKKITVIKIY